MTDTQILPNPAQFVGVGKTKTNSILFSCESWELVQIQTKLFKQ